MTSTEKLKIRETFSDKCILLTGVTGFVGKVLLEKLLATTRIGRIYLLIRDKPKFTLEDRMMREIFGSAIFKPLFQKRPELIKIVKQRVIPIKGDLVLDRLGMDPEVRKEVTNNCQFILNSAASINFDDPIRDAM